MDPCEKCEEYPPAVPRPRADRVEKGEAEAHLDSCSYCRKRYTFEASLRRYVRTAWVEPMPADLKAKLSALRTPL